MAVDIRNHNLPVVHFSPLSRGQRLREQTAGVKAFLWRLYRRFFVPTKKWCVIYKVSHKKEKPTGTVKTVPYLNL